MTKASPPVFTVRPPENEAVPLVVSIPHTGTFVPEEINDSFASDAIRALPMTDWHLHKLYDFLPSLGVTTIYANYSRFVVDLNRPPDATPLYPGRYETGLVATQTFQGEQIFRAAPDAKTVEQRRLLYHAPYHQKLPQLLEECAQQFNRVVLIDAHSVASKASLLHGELTDDIYLGNRDDSSCEPWLIDQIDRSFSGHGLKVVRNAPYKGGHITAHYGQPPAVQALQIEMCQRLYMEESDPGGALSCDRFQQMKRALSDIFKNLAASLASLPAARP